MFETVVKEINNGLDTLPSKLGLEEIGEAVGLKRQTVSGVLSNEKESSNFICYLKLAKVIQPNNYINKVALWASHFRKTENIKFSLEFLSSNKQSDQISRYIATLRGEVPSTLDSLFDAYELINEYQTLKELNVSFIDRIEKLKETLPESKFLKDMLKVYYYNYFFQSAQLEKHLNDARKSLAKVKKKTLKDVYSVRILEMETTYLLFKDNAVMKTRDLCSDILDKVDFFGAVYEANAYYKMGMSYFFESPDMCLHNLKKAAAIYRDGGYEDRAKKIEDNEVNLAKVMWGRVKCLDEVKGTPSEAHYLVTIGKQEEALKVIEGLNADSPFTKYYEGMARNNPFMLLESLKMLCDNGSNFYAKLPELALEKFPETKQLVKLINRGAGNQ